MNIYLCFSNYANNHYLYYKKTENMIFAIFVLVFHLFKYCTFNPNSFNSLHANFNIDSILIFSSGQRFL